jgi:hypothetical protein
MFLEAAVEVGIVMTRKLTIRMPADLYTHLRQLARLRRVTVSELVVSACRAQYRVFSREERLRAVERLGRMCAPVGTPEEMERESVPSPEELLP